MGNNTLIIDYENAMERFSGHKELYSKYIKKFIEKNAIQQLTKAMMDKDYDTAFILTHDLKSNAGNLGFERLYDKSCMITEMLREGNNISEAIEFMPQLKSEYRAVIEEIKNRGLYS